MKRSYRNITDHYEECFLKYGDTHKGADWPDRDKARIRYGVMLDLIPGDGDYTLLDFGCGSAIFLDFLTENSIRGIKYTGLDISENIISFARKKYPGITFMNLDVLETPERLPVFDYIIMNGIFTEKRDLAWEEMFDYFRQMVRTVFPKANKGIAFNVMSKQVDWERDDLFHLPLDILAYFITREVSRNFIIRNDYGLYEYTVYLFKQPGR